MTAPPVNPRPASIVGREAELDSIAAFVDDAGAEPRALLLEGDAGLGKTTLWRWGVERARRQGVLLLTARPGETEAALPFAALGDVLAPIAEETIPTLAPRHRSVLELALTRVEPGEPVGRLALARAVLAVLETAGNGQPFVLAIDDAQWLDPASADALSFAIRRLDELPARILTTRRRDSSSVPLGLDGALPPERLTRISLDPLSIGELDRLLRTRIELVLRRPQLLELHRVTAGNPFYALEIGRAAAAQSDDGATPEDLPVPDSLSELLRSRLNALSAEARDAILLAAATEHARAGVVEQAAGRRDGLTEAIREGLLELTGTRVAFAHPLLASVSYRSALPSERRQAHARLATVSDDALTRARHLALATEDPNETIAAELDGAALRAYRLGAPASAADLAAHACRLTPQSEADALRARTARSAEYHLAVGDSARGRALLEDLVARTPPGADRAHLLLRLGQVLFSSDEMTGAEEMFHKALADAGDELHLVSDAEQALAFTAMFGGDIPRALTHARRSFELADRLDDERLLALSLARVVTMEFLLGMGFDRDRMNRAIRLEERINDAPLEWLPSYASAGLSQFVDDLETAREIYADLHATALARGDERALSTVLFPLSQMECQAGNLALANRYANEAVERSRQSDLSAQLANALGVKAYVSALLGREDDARAALHEGMTITERTGAVAAHAWLIAAQGFLELSIGDPEAARNILGPLSEMIVAMGLAEPGVVRFLPDHIEALVALGELERARSMTDLLEERGRALDRPWALATGARSAALVAAAEGDFDEARAAIARALAAHERLGQPFELARTRLVEGTIERRAKRRGVARESLTAALEIFDSLGAPLWADRATAELQRIPGRAPASGELTETERRIAELVATGLSNKDIAAKLFVTVRTVEANLTRIYGKLGVHSRTELAHDLDRLPS